MRKIILLFLMLLLVIALPAMAVTFTAVGTEHPGQFTAITGVDNSVLYVVTSDGKLYSQAIATGILTLLATIHDEKLTAIVYPGATYTYIGTASGKIIRHTISGNTISKTTLAACTTPGAGIVAMKWDATLTKIWLITNKGKTYFCTP
jgi:ligand-binding sensor domain-containing protein